MPKTVTIRHLKPIQQKNSVIFWIPVAFYKHGYISEDKTYDVIIKEVQDA